MSEPLSILEQQNQIIINAGRVYAQMFEEDNLKLTEAMLRLSGCRKLMKWVYGLLVVRKMLAPLESLPKEEKENMWEFIKTICIDQHATKEKMHQMVIVFYTIEYFLNEQNKQA